MMRSIQREDVNLWFDDTSGGDPAFVFVHGFLGNHTHFAPQVSYFSPRHRCVSVDLRCHGRSDTPAAGYRVEDLADDVAFVCRELDLDRPLLAGHSLGGDVVAMVGARHPDLAGALVIIDAPVMPKAEIVEMVTALGATADAQELQEMAGDSIAYSPLDDPTIRRQIEEENWMAPDVYPVFSAQMAEWVRGQAGPAGDDMVQKWSTLVCLIETTQMNDIDRLKRLDPGVMVGQTVGSGHYVQLMAPGQVNAMIESISKMM